jgi:hypothetical protein
MPSPSLLCRISLNMPHNQSFNHRGCSCLPAPYLYTAYAVLPYLSFSAALIFEVRTFYRLFLMCDRFHIQYNTVHPYPSCITRTQFYKSQCTVRRGRILGRNWDKSLKSFLPCYSHSPLLTDFTTPLNKSDLKLVCNVKET